MIIIKTIRSKNEDVRRFLQKTQDNFVIENSYCNLDEHIICISTQVGCQMGCIFCATSLTNDFSERRFERNLTAKEIVAQVENVLKKIDLGKKPLLFSFMGVGEPFANYDSVIKAIKILNKTYPKSRVTVSTIGLSSKLIKELVKENGLGKVKIHLSLHAPNDNKRKMIIPAAGKISDALEALKYYGEKKLVGCKVNYVLIRGLNDSEEDARELAELVKNYSFTVKLTKLHQVKEGLKGVSEKTYQMFESILKENGVKSVRYESNGQDIGAACGQLRKRCLKQ